ncbi:hypothetical protein QCE70_13945, partial [Staphylococcus aureus]|nr:hypothetical protein [Staphylococcus aureus]
GYAIDACRASGSSRKSEPSQDDMDQPLLLVPKILPFPKELELDLFSISIPEFLCVSTPLRDPEK